MAATPTILSTEFLTGGYKRVNASFLLDNSMPAGGYTLTPANFGFTRFKAKDDGSGTIDPLVISVTGKQLMARVIAGKLILTYPTGGSLAAPTTVANPNATPAAGATGVTSTAAQPAIPMTPGQAVDCPTATDLSAVTVVLQAVGV